MQKKSLTNCISLIITLWQQENITSAFIVSDHFLFKWFDHCFVSALTDLECEVQDAFQGSTLVKETKNIIG